MSLITNSSMSMYSPAAGQWV